MEHIESRADGIRRIAREKKLDLKKTPAEDLIVLMRQKGLLTLDLAMQLCDDFADAMAGALLEHAISIDDLDERIELMRERV